ncbi:MAG: hypothetical protein KA098_02490 [Phenylobacterium sp.]|nr:hypothetical protein [Phenylobacterium sp.]
MRLILFAAIAAMAAGGTASAASEESQETNSVLLLARQARSEFEARLHDQFAEVHPHSEMVGQPFTVTLPVQEKRGSFAFVGTYDRGVLRFSMGNFNNAFSVQDAIVSASSRVAQNSFGASVEVTSDVVDSVNIVAVDLPRGEAEYIQVGRQKVKVGDNVFSWSKDIDGPHAKLIYQGSRAVIDGQFAAKPDDGRVVHCGNSRREAKMSDPHEVITKYCNVSVRINRITFLSGDGTVLKEWRK